MGIALTDILAAADQKYGSYFIDLPSGETLRLRPVLRLPDEDKDKLTALQQRRDDAAEAEKAEVEAETADDAPAFDTQAYLREFITIVAKEAALVDELFALPVPSSGLTVGTDPAVLLEIVNDYSEATQPGEAKPSES